MAEAVEWWHKAAEQGLSAAQYHLGRACHFGDGTDKDMAEAMEWYRKAAELGVPEAKEALQRLGEPVLASQPNLLAAVATLCYNKQNRFFYEYA